MQSSPYDAAVALARAGRFADALVRLQQAGPGHESQVAQTLLAELLEHTGAYDEAVQVAERLRRSRQLPSVLASRCDVVLGHVAMTAGRSEDALELYRRAVSLARSADDLEQLCWAQIRLIYAERTRIDCADVRALLADLRANATRLGDPFVTAALHVFVGAVEGERGALDAAGRHLQVAESILTTRSNPWLQAEVEIGWTGIRCLADDIGRAESMLMRHFAGLASAARPSDAAWRWQTLATSCLRQGRLARSRTRMIERGLSYLLRAVGLEVGFSTAFSQASLLLGDLDECEQILIKSERSDSESMTFPCTSTDGVCRRLFKLR